VVEVLLAATPEDGDEVLVALPDGTRRLVSLERIANLRIERSSRGAHGLMLGLTQGLPSTSFMTSFSRLRPSALVDRHAFSAKARNCCSDALSPCGWCSASSHPWS
jgi:hypothetical protein